MAHLRPTWILAAALALATPGQGGNLQLQPTSVTLQPGEQEATVWIDNAGPAALDARARVFHWQQVDGEERLAPTPQVAVSPPIISVPPGGRQRLRIVPQSIPRDGREHGYRLIVDQLPGAPGSPAVRYSLPLFAPATTTGRPQLTARLEPMDGRRARLRIDNHGRRHARLVELSHLDADGRRQVLVPDLAGYVLAGRYKYWTLPGPAGRFDRGRFEALVDGKPVPLPVETSLLSVR